MKKIEIEGIKNYYYIADDGTVYSDFSGSLKERLPEIDKDGYKKITLARDDNGSRKIFVHRLVAMFYIPNPNNLPVVNHKDGNKINNLPSNLEWTTVQGNTDHAYKMGLIKASSGEDHYQTGISNSTAREIYEEYLNGMTNSSAMDKYNISRGTAERIRNKRIFKEVLQDFPECLPSRPKLTDSDVKVVCEEIQNNPNLSAKKTSDILKTKGLDVTLGSVSKIKARKSYLHISSSYDW